MKILIDWIPDKLLQAIGWTLIHSLWQLVLIAGLLWLMLNVLHRSAPATKYAIAVGALILSVLATVGTFLYEFDFSAPSAGEFNERYFSEISIESSSIQQADAGISAGIRALSVWIEGSLPLLVNIWILGALLFMFRLLNSLSELRGLRNSSSEVEDFQMQKMLYRLAGKMGIKGKVNLRVSSFGASPLTFGAIKPIILFPAGLLLQLSPAHLEAILAHELAHVRRNDYLANLLLSSLDVIFFFHPCYWWMNTTVKELRENAADDLVVKAGIEPKTLATSLAEVLNFAKQNPPELALAAGKHRNPTLQRIKRILGYPAQNYPQTPIISIPMLLTLFLSVGLMASAQQDAPKSTVPVAPKAPIAGIEPTFAAPTLPDTIVKPAQQKVKAPEVASGNHFIISKDGVKYRIQGNLMISGSDTVVMSAQTLAALDELRDFDEANMPQLDIPVAPAFPEGFAPVPDFDFSVDIPVMPAMPPTPTMDIPEFTFDVPTPMDLGIDINVPPFNFFGDTTEMTKEEKEKWALNLEIKAKEWEEKFQRDFAPKIKEFELKMEEWQAANAPKMKEFEERMKAWQEQTGPAMEAYQLKISEWEAANAPKMKEFEEKMKLWQEAQGPKMKEFEAKMEEWELAQKPKMDEFHRKMEVWKQGHEAKMEQVQKLLQNELKKKEN